LGWWLARDKTKQLQTRNSCHLIVHWAPAKKHMGSGLGRVTQMYPQPRLSKCLGKGGSPTWWILMSHSGMTLEKPVP
jgi:hypothetical protein